MAITDSFLDSLIGKTIALDSMIFIYFFDQNERFVEHSERIIKLAERGKTIIVTSIMSLLESLSPFKYQDDTEAQYAITNFFYLTPSVHIIDVDREVAIEAARLRREHKSLRAPDAIQLATAIVHKAEIFITNDIRLINLSLPGLIIQTLS